MSTRSRAVNLTLLDGDASGPIRLSLPRRTYSLYLMPVEAIERWRKDPDLNQAGIYMLLDDPNAAHPTVYIGKAAVRGNQDGIINRVDEHLRQNRHLWTRYVVMLVDNPTSFNATELQWLESAFIQRAAETGLSKLENKQIPQSNHVSEEFHNDLTATLDDARLMLNVMRLYFLGGAAKPAQEVTPTITEKPRTPKPAPTSTTSGLEVYLGLRGSSTKAILVQTGDTWTLKAGSPVSQTIKTEDARALRETHSQFLENCTTTADITFASSSAAAKFVAGANRSGPHSWRDASGVLLHQLLNSSAETPAKTPAADQSAKLEPTQESSSLTFFLKVKGSKDKAVLVGSGEKWVLKSGSPLQENVTNHRVQKHREIHAAEIRNNSTVRDISFQSPSTAASFVSGNSRNGRVAWRDAQGTSLGELITANTAGELRFYLSMRGIPTKAVLVQSGEQWVLKAGSPVRDRSEVKGKFEDNLRNAHAKDIRDGHTIRDIVFSSSTAAAEFVTGANRSGPLTWVDANGTKLRDVLQTEN